MQQHEFTLISHYLCPYVQRSVIVLTEKNIHHERRYIDLSDKPEWFIELSPTGKVPVLLVDHQTPIFESAVICEYLNEITPGDLHSVDPLVKAQHRAWIEYGSQLLNDIAKLYSAQDELGFVSHCDVIARKWRRLDLEIRGDFFAGSSFGMVDAAFGPVFRYFDVLDSLLPYDVFAYCPLVQQWRRNLSRRPSVQIAVDPTYPDQLRRFLARRDSYLGSLAQEPAATAL